LLPKRRLEAAATLLLQISQLAPQPGQHSRFADADGAWFHA
jgi:hypothetical protein